VTIRSSRSVTTVGVVTAVDDDSWRCAARSAAAERSAAELHGRCGGVVAMWGFRHGAARSCIVGAVLHNWHVAAAM
jgi:hypothetical protein